MSLFDRLLEEQLKPSPRPTAPSNASFEAKRQKWLAEALVKVAPKPKPAQPSPPPSSPPAVEVVEERAPVPRPTPPPPPVVKLDGALVARGSCKAINPETGRQCALLAGHTKPHRHGSTEFRFGAVPGQKFARREALDRAATSSRSGSTITPGDL